MGDTAQASSIVANARLDTVPKLLLRNATRLGGRPAMRFKDLGINVFRTDLDGDILLTSDGGEPTVAPAPLPF